MSEDPLCRKESTATLVSTAAITAVLDASAVTLGEDRGRSVP